jgi:hypothetical protein
MKQSMVWFGHMTHGTFRIGEDVNPMVIINSIEEKAIMDPDEVEAVLEIVGYDSYLILDEFEGDIVFAKDFVEGRV